MDWLLWVALIASIIGIVLKVISEFQKRKKENKLLDLIEKSRPNYDYNKILPHKVEEVKIEIHPLGNYEISFTPISIQQIDKTLFIMKIKSISDLGIIMFDFIINGKIHKQVIRESNNEVEYSIIGLGLNSKESDKLLILLARLFNIEIRNTTQIVKNIKFVTDPIKIELEELILKVVEITGYFLDENNNKASAVLKFEIDISNGIFKIIEVDQLLRPIIIEKLKFVPNIKK